MSLKINHIFRSRWAVAALRAVPLVVLTAGCAGSVQTPEEMKADDRNSQVNQLMRIAGTTRAGGDLAAAYVFYNRAHVLEPTAPEALLEMGETAAAMGNSHGAAAAFRAALELDSSNQRALLGHGRALIALNSPEQAAEQFRAVIALKPDDHRGYNGLGVALDLAGKHAEAQQHYRDAIERDPKNLSIKNNLALSLTLSGDYQASIGMLRRLATDPNIGASARRNLALAYAFVGATEQAAIVARKDLRQWQVENNLAYFDSLRELSGPDLAAAALGVRTEFDDLPTDIFVASGPDPAQIADDLGHINASTAEREGLDTQENADDYIPVAALATGRDGPKHIELADDFDVDMFKTPAPDTLSDPKLQPGPDVTPAETAEPVARVETLNAIESSLAVQPLLPPQITPTTPIEQDRPQTGEQAALGEIADDVIVTGSTTATTSDPALVDDSAETALQPKGMTPPAVAQKSDTPQSVTPIKPPATLLTSQFNKANAAEKLAQTHVTAQLNKASASGNLASAMETARLRNASATENLTPAMVTAQLNKASANGKLAKVMRESLPSKSSVRGTPASARKTSSADVHRAKPQASPSPQTEQVRSRTGEHPGFSRVVFDWPSRVDYSIRKSGNKADVIFERPADLKLDRSEIQHLRNVRDASVQIDEKRITVSFVTSEAGRVRHFRLGCRIVIDIAAARADLAKVKGATYVSSAADPSPNT